MTSVELEALKECRELYNKIFELIKEAEDIGNRYFWVKEKKLYKLIPFGSKGRGFRMWCVIQDLGIALADLQKVIDSLREELE